jgi:NADPH-dependent curcumin reductase CurA
MTDANRQIVLRRRPVGEPTLTAYVGLLDIGRPEAGETVAHRAIQRDRRNSRS